MTVGLARGSSNPNLSNVFSDRRTRHGAGSRALAECQTPRMRSDDSSDTQVVKWKWSLVTGRCTPQISWAAQHLGVDDHGTWLGARRGNAVHRSDGRDEGQAHDGVWLIPPRQFWLAAFWFTPTTDLTIDICRPAIQQGASYSFVDLELDLYRNAEGEADIVDRDEFAALAAAQLVSEQELNAAVTTADRLLTLVEQRAEPFGQAAEHWLQQLQ